MSGRRSAAASSSVSDSLVLAIVLWLDVTLAFSGVLPGGSVVGAAGLVIAAAAVVALFTAVGRWTPGRGWRVALRQVPGAVRADPVGAAYLLATGVFAGVVTWQLLPLVIPALGCIAIAIFAVPVRPGREAR